MEKPLFDDYIKKRRKKEKELSKDSPEITISNNEIAQAFLLRVSDFSGKNTRCGLIATSKVLYNLQGKEFRSYFLHNYSISKVFELAPVRHEVFNQSNNDIAVGPAVVLFYKNADGENTDSSIIEHITLKPSKFFSSFKVFSLTKNDFKKVEQKELKKFDWLWKTLVYGSYLDFNFIKRLKDDYSSIGEELKNTDRFINGQGVTIGGGDPNDASHLVGLPFIDTKKDIKAFWINDELKQKWDISNSIVHRPRERNLYKAPMLLITKGISSRFRSISAVSKKDAVFCDSLTAIKAINVEDIKYLQVMTALLNSSISAYLALQTFSSVGIEREQAHNPEKWTIPFSFRNSIVKAVSILENLLQEYYSDGQILNDPNQQESINFYKNLLEGYISNMFAFSDHEKKLIDYAEKIVIPIEKKHEGYELLFKELPFENRYLTDYATLFLNRFKPTLDNDKQKFIAEIWHSRHIVGMLFKVVPNIPENSNDIVWIKKDNDLILQSLIKLGSQKITDQLFVQKDIRGFEADYFYIFKPNEKRLWHQAIGYIDVDEFMDAVLKAGRRGE